MFVLLDALFPTSKMAHATQHATSRRATLTTATAQNALQAVSLPTH